MKDTAKNKTKTQAFVSKRIKVTGDIIDQDQVLMIHEATLEVLRYTGIQVDSPVAAKIFEENGAEVTPLDNHFLVKIPSHVVMNAVRDAARPLIFYGRTPDKDFAAYKNCISLSTFGECVKTVDLETEEVRDTTKADLGNMTKLCDYFDEISLVERSCCSLDKPSQVQSLHNLEVMMKNTSKPIFIGGVNGPNARKMIEMAYVVAGGEKEFRQRPFLNIFVCPVSPLRLATECTDQIIEAARGGAGIASIPMPMAGATSPITLAGTLVNHNAELLSSLILAQMVKKGTRFTYCSMATMMDLKHTVSAIGSPEQGMLSAAIVKLAQFYELPSWVGSGLSDSKLADAQVGYEFGVTAMIVAMAGANVLFGGGALESGLTTDPRKLVMDCEAMANIRKTLQGIEVNEETLSLEVTHRVGPGEQYLRERQTFDNMRNQSVSSVFNRMTRAGWEDLGAMTAAQAACKKAKEILANHVVAPLPEGAEEKVAKIISDYEKEILK